MPAATPALPHWDLSNVYSALDGADFQADAQRLEQQIAEVEALVRERKIGRGPEAPADPAAAAPLLDELIGRLNAVLALRKTLYAYVYSFCTTDSYNTAANRRLSELERLGVRLEQCATRFETWIGLLAPQLDALCARSPRATELRAVLERIAEQSRYLMDPRLEDLAAELQLSGGGSMWKLQGTVTSQLKMPFEREGRSELLPITKLRNLAYDADPEIRRRAFETEIRGWESIRESVAFALNGVKGAAVTLAKWRGREDVLHEALDQNRIDRETLQTMMDAMRDSFPIFRRYLQSKARKLGKERLAWWDLFAPVKRGNPTYSWTQAADFIVAQFGTFSDELASFARHAFDRRWIDAEPRDGKRGGAFCMGLPAVEESRILANYDGSFDQMITLAHELGHGFHNHCQKGLPMLSRGAPMTLAETASIFCETLVLNAALDAAPAEAQVAILENDLIGATQVIVDIYARFLFESEVLRRRAEAELSADDLCEMIRTYQQETYGDGLDPHHLHPYQWLLKPHYYAGDLHFYNFPYAFGLLFGLGVYARYRREGAAFVPGYREFLRRTGAGPVADLAQHFGIDVRSRAFWDQSLQVIEERVERYCALDR